MFTFACARSCSVPYGSSLVRGDLVVRVRAKMEDDVSDLFNRLSCRWIEIIVLEAIYGVSLGIHRIGRSSLFWNSMEEDLEGLYTFVFVEVSSGCASIPAGPCCISCGLC